MISHQNMFISNADRISQYPLSSTVKGDVADGTWLELNDSSEWVKATGTKPAFICLSSRLTDGRDNITPTNGLVTVLHGSYIIATDMYTTNTYENGDKLTLADGKLKKAATADRVFAEVFLKPTRFGEPMYILGIPNKGAMQLKGPAAETLGTVTVSLAAGSQKVVLAPQAKAEGFAFYYKSTAADDASNKPALNSTDLSGWTVYTESTDITGVASTPIYVQVIKVAVDGNIIKAWGQATATPTA